MARIKGEELNTLRIAMFETLKVHNLHPFMVQNEDHAWQVYTKARNEGRIADYHKKYTDAHLATAFKQIFKAVRG